MRRRSAALVAVLLLLSGLHESTASASASASTPTATAASAAATAVPATAAVPSSHPGDGSDGAATATPLDGRPRISTASTAPPPPARQPPQSTQGAQSSHGPRNRTAAASHPPPHSTAHAAPHPAAARTTRSARVRTTDDGDTIAPSDESSSTSSRPSVRTAVGASEEVVHASHAPPHAATSHAPPHPSNAVTARTAKGTRMRIFEDTDGTSSSFADDSSTTTTTTTGRVMSRALADWDEFKRKNSKSYLNRTELNKMARMARAHGGAASQSDLLSDEDRMSLFAARKMAIEEHNKIGRSFKRSINHFADMTTEEVITKHTGLVLAGRKPKGGSWDSRSVSSRALAPLPHRFDWRERGALTEARNQGPCGCCWAFAATAAIEAKIFIRTKKLVALSEQNLLDCDNLNDKCDGGTPWDAFDWVQANGGQEENEKYPYEVLPDACRQDKARMYRLQVKGYMSVGPPTEENIMAALYLEGPLTVAVNALPASLQDYQEGVYADPECSSNEDDLHHAMLLVGWGDDPGVEGGFWILRNSWGREWGENGYIRINRKDNLCGVMTYAVFPSLEW